MYTAEFDAFQQTLRDLCVAVNRPVNDELVRVFWEDLRPYSLLEIQQRAGRLRVEGNQRFKSADLRPELKSQGTYEPPREDLDHFARFANIAFFKFLLDHDTTPAQLPKLIARKNDIVDAARVDPEMQHSDDEDRQREQAGQLREILWAAWGKVLVS